MGDGGNERTTRELRMESGAEVHTFRAIEAWRGASGHGLCYFVRLAGEGPDDGAATGSELGDDRADRRAVLSPGEDLAAVTEDRLRELCDRARPLTVTERRFSTADGRPWLVQNTGPVWADTGVAEGATGLLFTSLEGPFERARVFGGHVEELSEAELVAARERAFAPADEADEPVRS